MAEQIERNEFIDRLFGNADAAHTLLKSVTANMQYGAIHNQFKYVDISMEECTAVMQAGWDAQLAVGKLMDTLNTVKDDRKAQTRQEIVNACAEAAHEAWLAEKQHRLENLGITSWPSEDGVEQLVHWDVLGESIREFDRIVVGSIVDTMAEKGLVNLDGDDG
jgi:hypothetical protein